MTRWPSRASALGSAAETSARPPVLTNGAISDVTNATCMESPCTTDVSTRGRLNGRDASASLRRMAPPPRPALPAPGVRRAAAARRSTRGRDDVFLEIGPGAGALTLPARGARARRVVAVELDAALAARLRASAPANVDDRRRRRARRSTCAALVPAGQRGSSATSPTTSRARCCAASSICATTSRDVHVMLQDEVARRVAAPPGSKEYGILSVLYALWARRRHPAALPARRVRAAAEGLLRRPARPLPRHAASRRSPIRRPSKRLVQKAFAHRRKTLENNLQDSYPNLKEHLRLLNIEGSQAGRDAICCRVRAAGPDALRGLSARPDDGCHGREATDGMPQSTTAASPDPAGRAGRVRPERDGARVGGAPPPRSTPASCSRAPSCRASTRSSPTSSTSRSARDAAARHPPHARPRGPHRRARRSRCRRRRRPSTAAASRSASRARRLRERGVERRPAHAHAGTARSRSGPFRVHPDPRRAQRARQPGPRHRDAGRRRARERRLQDRPARRRPRSAPTSRRSSAWGERGVLALLSDSTNVEQRGRTARRGRRAARLRGGASRARAAACSSPASRRRSRASSASPTSRARAAAASASSAGAWSTTPRWRSDLGLLRIPACDAASRAARSPTRAARARWRCSSRAARASRSPRSRSSASTSTATLAVGPGDTVVLSRAPIPGNERAVSRVISNLFRRGCDVVHPRHARTSTSPATAARTICVELLRAACGRATWCPSTASTGCSRSTRGSPRAGRAAAPTACSWPRTATCSALGAEGARARRARGRRPHPARPLRRRRESRTWWCATAATSRREGIVVPDRRARQADGPARVAARDRDAAASWTRRGAPTCWRTPTRLLAETVDARPRGGAPRPGAHPRARARRAAAVLPQADAAAADGDPGGDGGVKRPCRQARQTRPAARSSWGSSPSALALMLLISLATYRPARPRALLQGGRRGPRAQLHRARAARSWPSCWSRSSSAWRPCCCRWSLGAHRLEALLVPAHRRALHQGRRACCCCCSSLTAFLTLTFGTVIVRGRAGARGRRRRRARRAACCSRSFGRTGAFIVVATALFVSLILSHAVLVRGLPAGARAAARRARCGRCARPGRTTARRGARRRCGARSSGSTRQTRRAAQGAAADPARQGRGGRRARAGGRARARSGRPAAAGPGRGSGGQARAEAAAVPRLAQRHRAARRARARGRRATAPAVAGRAEATRRPPRRRPAAATRCRRSRSWTSSSPSGALDNDAPASSEAKILQSKCGRVRRDGQRCVEIHPGPVVTTYEFKPDAGVKYSKIVGLADDLALALEAESIRIDRMSGKRHRRHRDPERDARDDLPARDPRVRRVPAAPRHASPWRSARPSAATPT